MRKEDYCSSPDKRLGRVVAFLLFSHRAKFIGEPKYQKLRRPLLILIYFEKTNCMLVFDIENLVEIENVHAGSARIVTQL